jgi:hypothetical protein
MMPLALLRRYRKVYFATPYRSFPDGPERAAAEAARLAGELMVEGVRLFAPIPYGHAICRQCPDMDPNDQEFWDEHNTPEMEDCEAIVVAMMPGWENSAGIAGERDFFNDAGRPVHFLDPVRMELR